MANLYKSPVIEAMKDMMAVSAAFIDDHIGWLRDNPIDSPDAPRIQRQMLNHLMILHPTFEYPKKLFKKKSTPFTEEKLNLYKKLYLLGRTQGDIPKCFNETCEMERLIETTENKSESVTVGDIQPVNFKEDVSDNE
jgi:hypothetical protein